jgi:hypothetical protein
MEISAERALKLGAGLIETFKGKTLMSTLVGMGVGWLLATEKGGAQTEDIIKAKVAEIMEAKAGRKATDYMAEAKDYAREFGAQAEKWAKDFGKTAQDQYRRACTGLKEMAEKKPVTLAAISVGAAAILGLGLWQILREKE